MNISSDKSSIFGDEEILITASASGFASDEAIFVKGAFFQDGSTNYFGYTKNGDSWIKNGENYASQFRVNISSWNGFIKIKSDFGDSGYKGEGDYKFKIGFYFTTSNGSISSVNWSGNILTISLSEPDPTPTPTLIATSTPSPAPTPVKTPSPSASPTRLPAPKSSPTSTPEVLGESSSSGFVENFIGLSNSIGNSDTASGSDSGKNTEHFPIIAVLLIGFGIILITLAIYLTIKKQKKVSSATISE